MRRLLLFIFFLSVLYSAAAKQKKAVMIDNPKATLNNGTVNVSFHGYIDKHAYGHNYEAILCPVIVNGSDTAFLPPIAAQNRHERILMKRQLRAGDYIAISPDVIYVRKDESFTYNVQLPYQKWMNHSDLLVYFQRKGCCNIENIGNNQLLNDIVFEAPQVKEPVISKPVAILEERTETFKIQFKVAQAEILKDFANNAEELSRIDRVINAQNEPEAISKLKEIVITGHVSPEGSYSFNYDLAQRRADALKSYIINKYPEVPASIISAKNGFIDWSYLITLVEKSDMKNKQALIDIIQNTDPQSDIEAKIQKLDGGKTYRYLLQHIYPSMRVDSGVKIYLIKK